MYTSTRVLSTLSLPDIITIKFITGFRRFFLPSFSHSFIHFTVHPVFPLLSTSFAHSLNIQYPAIRNQWSVIRNRTTRIADAIKFHRRSSQSAASSFTRYRSWQASVESVRGFSASDIQQHHRADGRRGFHPVQTGCLVRRCRCDEISAP